MAGLLTLLNQDDGITALEVQNYVVFATAFGEVFQFTSHNFFFKHFFYSIMQSQLHQSLINEFLKVRNLSGKWIPAPPVPGTFVCNIGDMLKVP